MIDDGARGGHAFTACLPVASAHALGAGYVFNLCVIEFRVMKSLNKPLLSIAIVVVVAMMLALFAPMSIANTAPAVVTSSRSFPKNNVVRRNLLAESTSVTVEGDSSDRSRYTETLNVKKTKSTKELQAEQKAKEQAAQEEDEREQQAAASRSQERQSLSASSSSSSSSSSATKGTATGSAIAALATSYEGNAYVRGGETPNPGWDCSGFVKYIYAQFGITLPRVSGSQATVGTAVGSLAEAQPGDIVANGIHSGIYLGNGLIISALLPSLGTRITGTEVYTGAYSIRRVV